MLSLKTLVLGGLGLFLGSNCFGASVPSESVTLGWTASPSAAVVGYRLYQGPASQTYTNTIDVGTLTDVTVSNLTAGATYFFAVTAYDSIGLESTFSDEISFTASGSASLRISVSASGGVVLTGAAPSGYRYDVYRTSDLKTWVHLGSVAAGSTGAFRFTDSLLTGAGAQYYRVQQTSP